MFLFILFVIMLAWHYVALNVFKNTTVVVLMILIGLLIPTGIAALVLNLILLVVSGRKKAAV